MTALLASEEEPLLPLRFGTGAEYLPALGIKVFPTQLGLLTKRYSLAMTLWTVPEPVCIYCSPQHPLYQYDKEGKYGERVHIPILLEIEQDEQTIANVGDYYSYLYGDPETDDWRRYPSVIAWPHAPGPFADMCGECPEPFRLWDVWPIDTEEAGQLRNSIDYAWGSSGWDDLHEWWSSQCCNEELSDPTALSLEHRQWFEATKERFADSEGEPCLDHFRFNLELPEPLARKFNKLKRISEANWVRLINELLIHEPMARYTESRFCPWC